MLLIPNALCWSSRKCNCACALPAEVQLRLRVTRRSWQKLFAGKNFVKILVTAQTQLRSYSEQQRAFGNSNICNCVVVPIYRLLSVASHHSFTAFQVKLNLTFVRHWNAITSQFLCSRVQCGNATQLQRSMNGPLHRNFCALGCSATTQRTAIAAYYVRTISVALTLPWRTRCA